MINRINQFLDRIFYIPKPLPACKFSTMLDVGAVPARAHLRISNDGNGILILNASTVLHLNQTAAEIAYHLANKLQIDEISSLISKRYQVSRENALQDIEDFKTRIETLINTPDLDPETFLDMERVERHGEDTVIPLRIDCALTYQIPSGKADLYAPTKRVGRALDTEEWKVILKQAWEWGIPHVVFTGGEPTLRPDLQELIQFSEDLGMVTGLITDGDRLADKSYLSDLLNAGLDHLMILINNKKDTSLEAIRDAVSEDIHVTVHLTITEGVLTDINNVLDQLVTIGVQNISLSITSKALETKLAEASRAAVEKGFKLIYDLPVPYGEMNPVNLELEEDQTTRKGAAVSWVYVEPDGDVLPGQGYPAKLGNLFTDGWMNISANRKLYLSTK